MIYLYPLLSHLAASPLSSLDLGIRQDLHTWDSWHQQQVNVLFLYPRQFVRVIKFFSELFALFSIVHHSSELGAATLQPRAVQQHHLWACQILSVQCPQMPARSFSEDTGKSVWVWERFWMNNVYFQRLWLLACNYLSSQMSYFRV